MRISDGDVEAFIARALLRRRRAPRKAFETDLVDDCWFWIDQTMLENGWILSIGADITARKRNEKPRRWAYEAALKASRTDQPTGLPNRSHILGLLNEALAVNVATGSDSCSAVIDIDHFKAINDADGTRRVIPSLLSVSVWT